MTEEMFVKLLDALQAIGIALAVIAGSCLWLAITTLWRK